MTLAPTSTKVFAIASPMPIEAPVTTTIFPSSSMLAFVFSATSASQGRRPSCRTINVISIAA